MCVHRYISGGSWPTAIGNDIDTMHLHFLRHHKIVPLPKNGHRPLQSLVAIDHSIWNVTERIFILAAKIVHCGQRPQHLRDQRFYYNFYILYNSGHLLIIPYLLAICWAFLHPASLHCCVYDRVSGLDFHHTVVGPGNKHKDYLSWCYDRTAPKYVTALRKQTV